VNYPGFLTFTQDAQRPWPVGSLSEFKFLHLFRRYSDASLAPNSEPTR